MLRCIRLYLLELKNAIKSMGISMAVLVLIIASVTLGIYGYIKSSDSEAKDEMVVIGVVLGDSEDTLFPQLIDFANGISSLKGFCRLEIFDREDAMSMLKNGELQMVMEVPDGFMEAAEHMQEAEFTLYLSENMGPAEYEILALFHGVEQIMIDTESGILAMYDGMEQYEFTVSRGQMEEDIMTIFVMNFIGRDSYFDTHFMSAYGDYSVIQYYIVSIVLLLIWMTGLAYFGIYGKNERRLEMIMSRGLWQKWMSALAKIMCIAIGIFMELCIFLALGRYIASKYELYDVFITAETVRLSILVAISMAAIVHLVATVTDSNSKRVTVYLLIVLLISLLSGAIGSVYYLPDILRPISGIWPMSHWHQLYLGSIWGSVDSDVVRLASIMALALVAIGGGLYVHKLNGHE